MAWLKRAGTGDAPAVPGSPALPASRGAGQGEAVGPPADEASLAAFPGPGGPGEGAAPPAPGAAPSPGAAPAPLQDLAEHMSKLVASLEQDRSTMHGVSEKMTQMEERIRGITTVSESLNADLNPFLGEAPGPEGMPGAHAAPVAAAQPALVPAAEGYTFDPAAFRATPSLAGLAAESGASARRSGLAPPALAPSASAPVAPRLSRWVVMMHWVDFLLDHVGSEGLWDIVEFYEKAGWVDAETAQLMHHYHTGMVRTGPVAAKQAPAGPKEAMALHLKSLRYLDLLEGSGEPTDLGRLLREMERIRGVR